VKKKMGIGIDQKVQEQIKELAQKYAIEKIILFGSRARGDNSEKSDIDIAVYPMPEFQNIGRFTSDIDELNTLLKVDMVFINKDTEAKLIHNISKEGVVIYERPSAEV